ncbi:hypothetical protein IW145_000781 [Coemansia sp. RSA 521]|nr:hypothetical protein IW145_000781 [Coemansia sp. RSA 521]
MTYDSMATNSLIAQPGTGLSSSLSHSPPKMLHGYGAPAAQKPLKLHKSREDSKSSKKRWSTQLPLTTVTGSTSYQAFDHSSSHQPLTHSVLALPSTAPAHQPKPQQKAKHNGLAAATAAAAAATAAVATSRVIHSSSSANTTASANKHTSTSWTHDSRGHQQPAIEHGTPPSVLESDMASAGFSGMYSKYVPKKSSMKSQGHSPPSVHPQIRSSALAHAQPPPVPQTRTHPHSYPMPQPIHMSGSSLFSHHHAERHHRPQRNHTSSHQRRSHNNPGPFSMPNLTHGSLGGYQSNVYQSQPLMAGNGSASFVLPKKHVRFAN